MNRNKFNKHSVNRNEENEDDLLVLLDNIPKLSSSYDLIEKIGTGTFSSVYLGRSKNSKFCKDVAIKYIIPTSHPSRVYMELKCLKVLGGMDNIIEAVTCFRCLNHIAFVMPYVNHDHFIDYCGRLSTEEICDYIVNLFIALKRVHSFNIIHRDIKPANFLYSRKYRKYSLVDFGLAQEVGKSIVSNKNVVNSPNLTNDELLNIDKKRKFAASSNHLESERKKARHSSPKSPTVSRSPLSSTGAKVNGLDSPSKHTRLAELCRKAPPTFDHNDRYMNSASNANSSFKTGSSAKSEHIKFPSMNMKNLILQEVKTLNGSTKLLPSSCTCYGSGRICRVCTARSTQIAPRAGTPGYRAPEVLIRHPSQDTAVDIWSAGVIILSLISGQYPFFRATDDLTSLAEITTVLGTKLMRKTCSKLDKLLSCSEEKPPLDLRKICKILKSRFVNTDGGKSVLDNIAKSPQVRKECEKCHQSKYCICLTEGASGRRISYSISSKNSNHLGPTESPRYMKLAACGQTDNSALKQLLGINIGSSSYVDSCDNLSNENDESDYPRALYDLLYQMLDPHPGTRISANEALKHPFVKKFSKRNA